MKDVLVQTFPIPGLEYVFLPPGLPLIAKTADKPATTSILVRGGAGTGKTTLAAAIAHGIAKAHQGIALYLTTEFVPAELLYKARLLGLPGDTIADWTSKGPLPPGAIIVEHLMKTSAGGDAPPAGIDRKRAAINAVWELLSRTDDAGAGAKPPVRVVAIDAFGLPEAQADDRALRADLLALIQALEMDGISTILVEETGSGSAHWFPFIADIVLELGLSSDPDTGELIRKLTCPKSRYTPVLPGPHDYGLDSGKPALWPDILPAVPTFVKPTTKAVDFFLPFDRPDAYGIAHHGIIITSIYGTPSRVLSALNHTPGVRHATVNCGPLTSVILSYPHALAVPDNEGPFSLGWVLLRAAMDGTINAVVVQELSFLLSFRRFRPGLFRVFEILRALGMVVCIHDRSSALSEIIPMADYAPGVKRSERFARRTVDFPHCSSTRWVPEMIRLQKLRTHPEALEMMKNLEETQRRMAYHDVDLPMIHTKLRSIQPESAGQNAAPARLELAIAFHQLGATKQAVGLINAAKTSPDGNALSDMVSRAQSFVGDDIGTANTILPLDATLAIPPSLLLLWHGLCAVYGRNDQALTWLKQHIDERSLGLLLRALAIRGQLAEADSTAQELGTRYGLPAWFIARLQADIRLDPERDDIADDAAARLTGLTHNSAVPCLHRAEVFYNLGLVYERTGKHAQAVSCYEQAVEINPYLEAATHKLAALGVVR